MMTSMFRQGISMLGALAHRPVPIYVHFGVTHRCNMRCRMCAVWARGDRASELSAAQVDVLAENLSRAGTRWIALGGGEPFQRADVAALVESFARRGMEVRLLTNGVGVADERIIEVAQAGVRHVSISLDTLQPERLRRIYGSAGVLTSVEDSMQRFRAVLPRRSLPVVNVCVSKLNLDELPALLDFAADRGFHCSFVPVALAPSPDSTDGFAAHAPELAVGAMDRSQVTKAYGGLIEMKRKGAPIANSTRFLRDSVRYLQDGVSPWSCDAGRLYLSVSPEGDLSICHHYPAFARFDQPDLAGLMRRHETRRGFGAQRAACVGCMRPCWAEVTHVFRSPHAAFEAVATLRNRRRSGGRR